MSTYHEDLLERAAREMNQNEEWKFEMGSKEIAHNEYVRLKKIMSKKEFSSTPAKKCLFLRREGSVLILEMGRANPFPEPIKVVK